MTEMDVVNKVILQASRLGARLFRNNTGTGWTGSKSARLPDGSMVLKNPRPLRAGLIIGSSDCIGWTPITITPEMVGRTIAVFTALEVKDGNGRVSPEQKIFIGNVDNANGITGVVRSDTDVIEEIAKWKRKNHCSST